METEDLERGISALFAALAMALDDEEHKLTAQFRRTLGLLHRSFRDHNTPPLSAMRMLTTTDDILHVWAKQSGNSPSSS